MTPEENDLRRALEARSGNPSPQFRARLSTALAEGKPASNMLPALALVAALPSIVFKYLPQSNVFFGVLGGTSILIVVGVALDTIRQMEAQLMMRSYEGFLR